MEDPRLTEALLVTARRAADAAAAVHRRHAGRVDVSHATEKGTSDFVTAVDLEAQEAALDVIRRRHPSHAVLAEETDGRGGGEPARDAPRGAGQPARDTQGGGGSEPAPAARGAVTELRIGSADGEPEAPLWIVDPLDGTTNFLNRHPMYCASVAVCLEGRPVAGAVSCSPTGERWWAARGRGAFKDGRRVRVSALETLPGALVGTGFPFKVLDQLPPYLEELDRVLRATAGVRRGGSAALDLCFLADGTFDGFWERHLMPWDIAAGLIVVEEAGGVVTRLDGSEIDLTAPGDATVLGANSPGLHDLLGAVVRGAP